MKNWTQRHVAWTPHNQSDMTLNFHEMTLNFEALHIWYKVTLTAVELLNYCKMTLNFQALYHKESSHFGALHNCHEVTLTLGDERILPKIVWKDDMMGLWIAKADMNVQRAPENSCLSHKSLCLHEGWRVLREIGESYEVVCYCQTEHFEIVTGGRSEVAATLWRFQPEDEGKGGMVTMAT